MENKHSREDMPVKCTKLLMSYFSLLEMVNHCLT